MSQAAIDRQIRPIYDALDASANKSAIQQCNKVLKKYPDNELAKALKALATVRMNKVEETLPLCDEILALKPTDLETLNAMMHVLRALGRHSDLVAMYDEAYKKQPANEELGTQDFFANVRTGNWTAAQRIATRLHKTFSPPPPPPPPSSSASPSSSAYAFSAGNARYLYWAVTATMLQAHDPTTPVSTRPLLYKLAQRLLDGAGAGVPPHASADRFHLHLSVLKALGALDDAASLLGSEEGRAIAKTSLVVDELRREIVAARGDFEVEAQAAEERVVKENDRNWLEFLAILDGAFVAPDADKLSRTRDVLRGLVNADGTRERGPLLAMLELERRARERGLGSDFESENGLYTLLKLYVERFGDKACCFEDLKPYIALQDADELRKVTDFLDSLSLEATNHAALRRLINTHKLRRFVLLPAELTPVAERARADAYLAAYVRALPLGAELPATELQPADDLVLLAAQAFVGLWKAEGDVTFLHKAVAVLEFAARKSKHSYQVRLCLVRIYRLLSAPSLAVQHYHALNVKQVQNDTLSHFILARASTFSLAAAGDIGFTQECIEASNIYVSNSADTADFIVKAFAAEKYSQIPDFIAFEDRLDNSLQRDLVKLEHVRMRLTHEGPTAEIIDSEYVELKFIFDRLHHDNRDFDVLPNYQPVGQPTFDEQTLLFGSSPGFGWLMSFLRIYTRCFSLASDLDDTVEEQLLVGDRPKVCDTPESKLPLKDRLPMRKEEELKELTADELTLFDFAMALCEWLAPYHDHARPPPEAVLAEATKPLDARTGKGKGTQSGSGNNSPKTNGHKKLGEEPPAVKEAPECVVRFFDDMAARFKSVVESKPVPAEALHIATILQEASILLNLSSLRFKQQAVVKANKFGQLNQNLRNLRAKAATVLKDVSAELATIGNEESTSEQRRAFADGACKSLQQFDEFEHDSLIDVAKKLGDARKRVIEGMGKCLSKTATTLS